MSSDPTLEALARLETKLDCLMEKLDALLVSSPSQMLNMSAPMHTPNRLCPLCHGQVHWITRQTTGGPTIVRTCGCRPPHTTA